MFGIGEPEWAKSGTLWARASHNLRPSPSECVPVSPPPTPSSVSSSPLLPPPPSGSDAWSRSPTRSHSNVPAEPLPVRAVSLPLVPSSPSVGTPILPNFSLPVLPSFFFPSLFCRSSPLCTVRYVRCGSTVPEKTHTTAHAHTHAVTDTQLGPSCTQRQGFGNQ